MNEFLRSAVVYLAAAVVAVPVAKRLGLGSVLGYLLAGVVIGPSLLGFVGTEGQDVLHAAEFGVVMMLFIIGLELEPALLWRMRGALLGMGGVQVLLSTAVLAGAALLVDQEWRQAVAIGAILSLSSTAIVLQTLQEKGLMKVDGGEKSFAVLLFQDLAFIPILALLPLLATGDAVAAALLLVTGIAVLMQAVGLSPALGTFVAGVVLATSEFRHALEADIEPFKGLLLGLFFIAVGATIDFGLIAAQLGTVLTLVAGLLFLKFAVLWTLGRVAKMATDQHLLFALALAQGGEFGFVLLAFATQNAVLPEATANLLVAAIA